MHILIIGMTMSGKSHLAKEIAKKARANGTKVILLDPLNDTGWECDYKSDNKSDFLKVAKSSKSCLLIVDESGQEVGRYANEMGWLATQSRHWGHSCIFISQRAQMIDKTVRDQCEKAYIFRVSKTDSKLLSEEFASDELEKCNELERFYFYEIGRFTPAKKSTI